MKKLMKYLTLLSFVLVLAACGPTQSQEKAAPPKNFNAYWYAGEAEISSYQLEQARYGETHKGEAVLVFVTEPFSRSKQVKLDDWRDTSEDNVSVLKLNTTKKFLTGIYPYSMMSSTFKPVSYDRYPKMLKVTTSSQEWCGHTFMQLNLKDDKYDLKGFSYFESEGDVEKKVPESLLEDEIWTMIRLNPGGLPQGKVKLLPGTFYLRLRHQEAKPQSAEAKIESISSSDFSGKSHSKYSIAYENRSLSIYFEPVFPHTILGWEETYLSGFGKPQKLTTTAKRINTIKSAYWGKNSNSDRAIRKELGLSVE